MSLGLEEFNMLKNINKWNYLLNCFETKNVLNTKLLIQLITITFFKFIVLKAIDNIWNVLNYIYKNHVLKKNYRLKN